MFSRLKRAFVTRALEFLLDDLPRRLAKGSKSKVAPSAEFGSYDEALETCEPGYDSRIIAEVVAKKTEAYARRLATGDAVLDVYSMRPLAAIGFGGPIQTLRIIDFGGGAGVHYFTARALCSSAQLFDWRVVETESMCSGAESLGNSELSFFTSIGAALKGWSTPPDLVLSVGAIMCVPDPLQALEELLKLGAPRCYIGGTGLSPDELTRVMVQFSRLSQNGPGPLPQGFDDAVTAYPNTFVPRAQFEEQIASAGYRVLARKQETRNAWRAGNHAINQDGYLLERAR